MSLLLKFYVGERWRPRWIGSLVCSDDDDKLEYIITKRGQASCWHKWKLTLPRIAEKPKMILSLSYSDTVSADSDSTSKNWLKANMAWSIPIFINAHGPCLYISSHNDKILSVLESRQLDNAWYNKSSCVNVCWYRNKVCEESIKGCTADSLIYWCSLPHRDWAISAEIRITLPKKWWVNHHNQSSPAQIKEFHRRCPRIGFFTYVKKSLIGFTLVKNENHKSLWVQDTSLLHNNFFSTFLEAKY